jgi:hypothetical protein
LINAELILDVAEYLKAILKSGSLEVESSLHCMIATLDILSGSGECLNVDIKDVHDCIFRLLDVFPLNQNLSKMFFKVLWMSVIERREVDTDRIFALIRKCLELTMHLNSAGCAVGMMHFVRAVMDKYKFIEKMLETDHAEWDNPIGMTSYSGNVAWELVLMSKSFHPAIRNYANILSKGTSVAIPASLAVTKIAELVDMYEGKFNPCVPFNK